MMFFMYGNFGKDDVKHILVHMVKKQYFRQHSTYTYITLSYSSI